MHGLESKKEENDSDIAGNNSKPYKKRKKELAESLSLDKKLKAIFNNKQQQECIVDNNIKVETLASTVAVASEAVSPVGNGDNYHQHQQPPSTAAVVLEVDQRGPHQLHPQFYQLYQAGHVMATSSSALASSDYSTGGGQARPFRPLFPDLSSTSNHTNY